MKTLLTGLCIVIFSLFSNINSVAQTTGVYISGIIADTLTNQPLEFVTVGLFMEGNNATKSTYSKTDGSFRFTNIKASKYTLIINYMGYQPKKIVADIGSDKSLDLGLITLSPAQKQLKEVTVLGTKLLIKREADRISYSLQADPESKSSSVLDMMRKVPYLSVDANENILLKGNADYKIYINGKPSGMMNNNPKAVLKGMPASTIQRIEVITNPGAKYDAEGLAGIINIVTNKKVSDGYNGSVNFNESFPAGGPGGGASFSARAGKLGVSASGGVGINKIPQTGYDNTRVTSGAGATTLNQNGLNENDVNWRYFGNEISYEIDSLKLLSAQLNLYGNSNNGLNSQASVLNTSAAVLQQYDQTNDNHSSNKGLDANLNYQLGFKNNKNKLLTLSYQFSNYFNKRFNYLVYNDRLPGTTILNRQNNAGMYNEHTLQADYVQPIKKVNMEMGVKAIFRHNKSDFEYLGFNNNQYAPIPDLSDGFNNTQVILGAYNNYRFSLKTWDFSGGIRLENTNTDVSFVTTPVTVNQDYFNLVPSVSINKNFKDRSTLNFGYSQRIKRPGINRLNPFVDRSNPNYETSGNPNLHPAVINTLQLGYGFSKKLSFNLGLGYSFFKDLDLLVATFNPATNITTATYQNVGRGNAMNADLNVSYPITQALKVSLNGNLTNIKLTYLDNGLPVQSDYLSKSFYFSAGYKFNKGWRVNSGLQYNGRNQISLQGINNPVTNLNFEINKDIIKDKLSVNAKVNNPFKKYRTNQIVTTGADFVQTDLRQDYYRSFRLSLNYNFGKLKEGVQKSKRGIKNNDLSN